MILNNTKIVNEPDGSMKLTTSLFVNAAMLPLVDYSAMTVKAVLPPLGKPNTVPPGPVEPPKPGTEVEIFVEVMIPRKAAPTVPTPKAPVPPAPAKGFVQEPLGPRTLAK